MKKKRISLPLVLSSLFALSTVAGCSNVPKPKSIVVDGQEIHIQLGEEDLSADQLFQTIKDENGIGQILYNTLLDYVVRLTYPLNDEIRDLANEELSTIEDQWRSEAQANGQSYAELRDSKISGLGFDSIDDYRESLEYKYQLERLLREYWDSTLKVPSTTTNVLQAVENYVTERAPYHVKHILVKLSDAASNLDDGVISEAEATKLSTVCKRIVDDSFDNTALDSNFNDDFDSSKAEGLLSSQGGYGIGGDLGIMEKQTSFVNEFKLGTYIYDIITNGYDNKNLEYNDKDMKNRLLDTNFQYASTATSNSNLDDSVLETTEKYTDITNYFNETNKAAKKFKTIDRSACDYLGEVASKTAWTPEEYSSTYGYYFMSAFNYPRSVIYNNFFNNHDISLLTVGKKLFTKDINGQTVNVSNAKSGNVTTLPGYNDTTEKVVTDNDGNPIFVVRTAHGVHFIAIEKSPFEIDAPLYYSLKDAPSATETKEAFVSNGKLTSETPSKFVTAKQNALTSHVKRYISKEAADGSTESTIATYQLFIARLNEYVTNGRIVFSDENLKNIVVNYLQTAIDNKDKSFNDANATSWIEYYKLLQRQFELEDNRPNTCLMIPKQRVADIHYGQDTSILTENRVCTESEVPHVYE